MIVADAVMANLMRWIVLAEEAAPPQPGIFQVIGMPLILVVVMYILIVHRPQQREQAQRQAMLAAIKKNDRVLTTSGIYGVVTNVQSESKDVTVTVRVDETSNTKLRMTLSAIARILRDDEAEDGTQKST